MRNLLLSGREYSKPNYTINIHWGYVPDANFYVLDPNQRLVYQSKLANTIENVPIDNDYIIVVDREHWGGFGLRHTYNLVLTGVVWTRYGFGRTVRINTLNWTPDGYNSTAYHLAFGGCFHCEDDVLYGQYKYLQTKPSVRPSLIHDYSQIVYDKTITITGVTYSELNWCTIDEQKQTVTLIDPRTLTEKDQQLWELLFSVHPDYAEAPLQIKYRIN